MAANIKAESKRKISWKSRRLLFKTKIILIERIIFRAQMKYKSFFITMIAVGVVFNSAVSFAAKPINREFVPDAFRATCESDYGGKTEIVWHKKSMTMFVVGAGYDKNLGEISTGISRGIETSLATISSSIDAAPSMKPFIRLNMTFKEIQKNSSGNWVSYRHFYFYIPEDNQDGMINDSRFSVADQKYVSFDIQTRFKNCIFSSGTFEDMKGTD